MKEIKIKLDNINIGINKFYRKRLEKIEKKKEKINKIIMDKNYNNVIVINGFLKILIKYYKNEMNNTKENSNRINCILSIINNNNNKLKNIDKYEINKLLMKLNIFYCDNIISINKLIKK